MKTVSHPSWLSTLIAGKYEGESLKKTSALQKQVYGAMMINIADDPDLIDATGGYNFGCYIKTLNSKKAKMWLGAGLDKDWVIQKLNKHKISNIAHLERFLKKYSGKKVTITAARDYGTKEFEIKIP